MNLREKNFILVAPFLSNFEFKIFLHYALLCCTMYYSIQYSTQVEHTVGVAARVSPRREQYVVVCVVVPPSTGTLAMAFADKSIDS